MKFDFKQLCNGIKMFAAKNTPDIAAGLGVAAFIGSGIIAVCGTVKAVKRVEEVKKEKGVENIIIYILQHLHTE